MAIDKGARPERLSRQGALKKSLSVSFISQLSTFQSCIEGRECNLCNIKSSPSSLIDELLIAHYCDCLNAICLDGNGSESISRCDW